MLRILILPLILLIFFTFMAMCSGDGSLVGILLLSTLVLGGLMLFKRDDALLARKAGATFVIEDDKATAMQYLRSAMDANDLRYESNYELGAISALQPAKDQILGNFWFSYGVDIGVFLKSIEGDSTEVMIVAKSRRIWQSFWQAGIQEIFTDEPKKTIDQLLEVLTIMFERDDIKYRDLEELSQEEVEDEQAVTALINGYESAPQSIKQALLELAPTRIATLLIAALGHDSPAIRTLAANLLTGSSAFIQPLIAALGDENPRIREQAGELLTQQGQNVVPALIVALSDPNERVRTGASEVLGRIGASRTVDPLLRVLEEGDERPALGATRALVQIGEPAVEALIERLTSQNEQASQRAGGALVQIGEPAVKPLIEILATYPPAGELLVQMKADAIPVLSAANATDLQLLKRVLSFEDEELRVSAVEGLVRIGEPAVDELINLMSRENERVAEIAADGLGKIGEPAVKPLLTVLKQTPQATHIIHQRAAGVLRQIGRPAVKPLIEISDTYPQAVQLLLILKADVRAVLSVADATDLPLLKRVLSFKHEDLRGSAVEGLARIGEPVVDELIDLMSRENERVGGVAADGLVKIGEPAVKPLLMGLDQIPQATDIISRIGAAAVPLLVEALEDETRRGQVITLLVEIGEPALDHLYEALDQADETKQEVIVDALCRVEGKSVIELSKELYNTGMRLSIFAAIGQSVEQWQELVPFFRLAVKLDPEFADAHYQLARAYVKVKQADMAVPHYEKALISINVEWFRDYDSSRRWLIDYYRAQAEFDKALRHAEVLAHDKPDSAESHKQLVVLYTLNDQEEKAHTHLERAIELGENEGQLSAAIAKAAIVSYKNILTEAKLDESKLRYVLPLSKKALFHGEKYLQHYPTDKAMQLGMSSLRSILVDELDDVDRHEMAFIYRLRGDIFLNDVERFISNPSSAGFSNEMSEKEIKELAEQVLIEDAIPAFQKALQLKADYVAARQRFASTYVLMGRYQEAVDLLEEGIRLSPDLWRLYFTLGDFQSEDQPQAAIKTYRKGLEYNPSWAAGYRAIAGCYFQMKDYDNTVVAAREALRIQPDLENTHSLLLFALTSSTHSTIHEIVEQYKIAVQYEPESIFTYILYVQDIDGRFYKRMVEAIDSAIRQRRYSNAMSMLSDWSNLLNTLDKIDPQSIQNSLLAGLGRPVNRTLALMHLIMVNFYNQVGEAFESTEAFDKYIEQSEKVVRRNPKLINAYAEAYSNKARHFIRKKQPHRALALAEKAIEIDETCHECWATMVSCYAQLGNTRQMLQCLEIAAQLGNQRAIESLRES